MEGLSKATEFTWSLIMENNLPLTIEMAYDILDYRTSFPPMVWLEERYSREVKPGEVFPPGVLPSRWIEQREFFMYTDDDSIMAEHGKTWLLFLRKPNDDEYGKIKWKE